MRVDNSVVVVVVDDLDYYAGFSFTQNHPSSIFCSRDMRTSTLKSGKTPFHPFLMKGMIV